MRKGAQRQAVADGAVARDQMERAATGLPFLAAPADAIGLRLPALDGQNISRRLRQPARKNLGDAVARLRILELRVLRRDIRRQVGFFDQPLGGILVSWRDEIGGNAEFGRHRAKQRLRRLLACAGLLALRCDALRVLPDRLQVAPPVERERPARQGFARIPFALPVMQESARRETVAQAPDQPVGERPLGRADRVGVPLARFEIVDRNEGRLAAHGQPDVVGDELLVDLLAERVERFPGSFRERLGDARDVRTPARRACRN